MADVMDGIMRSPEELAEEFHYRKWNPPLGYCGQCLNRIEITGEIFCDVLCGYVEENSTCDKYKLPF
jgi:hypothetical protein